MGIKPKNLVWSIEERSIPKTNTYATDTVVSILGLPENIERPQDLWLDVVEKRGGILIRIGDGYSKHRGKRSMLGQAYIQATFVIDDIIKHDGGRWL